MLCSHIANRRGHKKLNQKVREYLYHCIIHHPQVLKSPIANSCLYVSIGGHSKIQLIPKLLLQVYVLELHNIMMSPPEEVVIEESRD